MCLFALAVNAKDTASMDDIAILLDSVYSTTTAQKKNNAEMKSKDIEHGDHNAAPYDVSVKLSINSTFGLVWWLI